MHCLLRYGGFGLRDFNHIYICDIVHIQLCTYACQAKNDSRGLRAMGTDDLISKGEDNPNNSRRRTMRQPNIELHRWEVLSWKKDPRPHAICCVEQLVGATVERKSTCDC